MSRTFEWPEPARTSAPGIVGTISHGPREFGWLVRNLKRRTVFRPGLAVIVNPGGGDIGVAEPLLDLGDVGLMVERIGGGRRPQRMTLRHKPRLPGAYGASARFETMPSTAKVQAFSKKAGPCPIW